jgi:UDP-2,3-diacylglucosamine pyrophosphatase LpxH
LIYGEYKEEDSVVKYAEKNKVSSILCGHIHSPVIKKIGGITYYNDGCWVENCSAIIEYDDGSIELKYFNDH